MSSLLTSLLLLLIFCVLVLSQPNTPQTYNSHPHNTDTNPCADINVQAWKPIPDARVTTDAHFDKTVPADYASINTANDYNYYYPLGYRKGQVYEDNNPPFCFNINNVQNKQVQLMVQTVDPDARLCFKDNSNQVRAGSVNKCFNDRVTACFNSLTYTNQLQIVFYCDSSCATTATPFWYRVRVSDATWDLSGNQAARANSAIDNLEMWCMMQDQNTAITQYPSDLQSEITPYVLIAENPGGYAHHISYNIILLLSLMLAVIIAIFKQ